MEVKVANQIELINPPDLIVDEILKRLVVENPDYTTKMKLGLYARHIDQYLSLFIRDGENYILPFGSFEWVYKLCRENKINLEIKTYFPESRKVSYPQNTPLYDYQERALNALLKYKNGCLKAPCGSGKTRIGLCLIAKLGLKALWLTHTKDLLNQSLESARSLFPDIPLGTITDGKINVSSHITFATVQTLSKLDPKLYKNVFDVVIVDEAHHSAGSPTNFTMFYKVVSNINARYKFGLSATYARADGLIDSVYQLLGSIKCEISDEDVAKYRVPFTYLKKVDLKQEYLYRDYTDTDGMVDFSKLCSTLAFNKERNEAIFKHIKKCLKDTTHYHLVLANRIGALDELEELFRSENIEVIKVNGKIKDRSFELTPTKRVILATSQLAKEGLDIPKLDTLHIIAPIKDEVAVIQSIGRVQRKASNKESATIYDYVDTNIEYCKKMYYVRKHIYNKLGLILKK